MNQPSQQQDPPGHLSQMDPVPDCGESTYRGSGKLDGRVAIATGGDSGTGRTVVIAIAREAAVWDAQLSGDALALLFLDLDGFKAVNDELGHAPGDELLRLVGERLTTRLRRTDLLARLGGDEFLVALLGLAPEGALDEAHPVAEVLEAVVAEPVVAEPVVAEPVVLGGREVTVATSIGIAVCPTDGADFGGLLHVADQRMYARKHQEGSVVPR